ncbi:threonine ammonia-lyase [Clostridia bacterium OttesenSCG-928-F22]|nr:threonine ammonia-lyase [Clostridia bacterium OttesenSCG-928-F22]
MVTLDRVYQAAHALRGVVRETDVIRAYNMAPDCELYLKAENLQVTGSFKVRGAYFKVAMLQDEQKEKGIIACSAGNHAQGVALAAREKNIPSTIFMPSTAPLSKVEATRSYGAQIRLIDGVYDDAHQAALAYQQETGAFFVHPFDDVDVIAGQGTIGLELMEQLPDLDAVIVPVGGGGLIAGVAYAIKNLNPNCKVYGVQACGASSMRESLQEGKQKTLPNINTFADGIAVKTPGDLTFSLCSEYVDEVVCVSDDQIAAAILTLMERQKLVAEGAGAVAVAAAMFSAFPLKGKKVACIVSGGNIDVNILSRVLNRGLLTSGRISDLTIALLDKPGQLREVSGIIAQHGANVIKVNHNYGGADMDINGCYLNITMETRDFAHLESIKNSLTGVGYTLCEV